VRLLLLTAGSRGDVDPFLALAARAASEGHDVRIGVTREFVARAGDAGLDVAPLDGDYQALVEAQGVSAIAAMRAFRSTVAPMMAGILRSAATAALEHRPDVIVFHPKILSAELAAARLDVPAVIAAPVPVLTPTRAFPAPGVVGRDVGPLNRATYRATAAAGGMFGGVLKTLRSELGLPAKGGVHPPVRSLITVSPTLLARPADWPATSVITGQWRGPDEGGRPAATDPALDAFLADGRVLYAGFGSMAKGDPVARTRTIVDAGRAAGYRVLLATGWGGLAADDLTGDDVLVRREVDHEAVLPRCAVAIHHGGAGTTHAVVRAGVPSIVVPFLADQPFWGRLLERAGASAGTIPAGRLTGARLAAALDRLPDRGTVEILAARVRVEDGTGVALRALEDVTDSR